MTVLQTVIAAAHVLLAIVVSVHIVLTKEDVRAAIGWTGLVWLTPVIGSVMYGLFGINRIRRQAGMLRRGRQLADSRTAELAVTHSSDALVPLDAQPSLRGIATIAGRVTGLLASYIFDRGVAGDGFVAALGRAVARGVQVRVLVDGVGARYSRPPIFRALRGHHVRVAAFLPPRIPLVQPYSQLRNHRKLMIVDGRIGFCGGMNIRDDCLLALGRPGATQDVHFRLRGPVVQQLAQAFAFDWAFTTKERLDGDPWACEVDPAGDVVARGLPEGPDEDFETLMLVLLGALSQARSSIRLATPYFLPDLPLVDALRTAALRGVRVEIVLPERGNLRMVEWAAMAQLNQVLKWGCHVYLSRRPFDHSKILVVDGSWSLVGSANWDPRSLRLNFEYNVECYSTELAGRLERLLDQKIASGRRMTLADLEGRPLPLRLRDGIARLAQPYL